jgi:hypothetical protein
MLASANTMIIRHQVKDIGQTEQYLASMNTLLLPLLSVVDFQPIQPICRQPRICTVLSVLGNPQRGMGTAVPRFSLSISRQAAWIDVIPGYI